MGITTDINASYIYMKKYHGLNCPNCGADIDHAAHGEYDDVFNHLTGEVDSGYLQPMKCTSCSATWNDIYVFTGLQDYNSNIKIKLPKRGR